MSCKDRLTRISFFSLSPLDLRAKHRLCAHLIPERSEAGIGIVLPSQPCFLANRASQPTVLPSQPSQPTVLPSQPCFLANRPSQLCFLANGTSPCISSWQHVSTEGNQALQMKRPKSNPNHPPDCKDDQRKQELEKGLEDIVSSASKNCKERQGGRVKMYYGQENVEGCLGNKQVEIIVGCEGLVQKHMGGNNSWK